MTNNIVSLEGIKEQRKFGEHLDWKRAFKHELIDLMAKHINGNGEQGCTPSMIFYELIDAAKLIKKTPPPPYPEMTDDELIAAMQDVVNEMIEDKTSCSR